MKNIAVLKKAGLVVVIPKKYNNNGSNYLWDGSAGLYDHALKIWEGLSQELNYNVMFSQRGMNLLIIFKMLEI